jgi:murein DD-endopeptidase MepM/ murein hydrolase activator NlpD
VAVWREEWCRAIASLVVLALAGCSAGVGSREVAIRGEGIYHQVRRGENLYRIGKAYGVSHGELARANGIADAGRLEVGQRIFVPGGTRGLPVSVITPEHAVSEAPPGSELPQGEGVFIWPLTSGTLTSSFGPRGRSFHDGIDIGASPGTVVRAAREGDVIYSDTLRGYGNVLIVQHAGGYVTVYAHNEENLVDAGSRVRQGQPVAKVGRSGRTSGPNLHFEIRKNNVARNPIYFLPSQTVQRAKDSPT